MPDHPPADEPRVLVYLDGSALYVPARVCCAYAFRGALGLARGTAVAYEHDPPGALAPLAGFTFNEGDRFVTLHASAMWTTGVRMSDGKIHRMPPPIALDYAAPRCGAFNPATMSFCPAVPGHEGPHYFPEDDPTTGQRAAEIENVSVRCAAPGCGAEYVTSLASFARQDNRCTRCGGFKAARIRNGE